MAANEETKTSVRRRFWAALQTKSVLACVPQMGVPEIKSNRSHPLLCRGRRVADLVDPYYVKSATALRELTISPRYPHMATISSSISRVVGRYRHDD
jgi:hypothetical protein